MIVTPDTVLRWPQRRFCQHWTQLSGSSTGGRPRVNAEIIALVRKMAAANPLWGCPRHEDGVANWAVRMIRNGAMTLGMMWRQITHGCELSPRGPP